MTRNFEKFAKKKDKVDLAIDAIRRTKRQLKDTLGMLETTERQLLHKKRP